MVRSFLVPTSFVLALGFRGSHLHSHLRGPTFRWLCDGSAAFAIHSETKATPTSSCRPRFGVGLALDRCIGEMSMVSGSRAQEVVSYASEAHQRHRVWQALWRYIGCRLLLTALATCEPVPALVC